MQNIVRRIEGPSISAGRKDRACFQNRDLKIYVIQVNSRYCGGKYVEVTGTRHGSRLGVVLIVCEEAGFPRLHFLLASDGGGGREADGSMAKVINSWDRVPVSSDRRLGDSRLLWAATSTPSTPWLQAGFWCMGAVSNVGVSFHGGCC